MLLVIYTAALEECRDFYSALGLTFTAERHGDGPDHYAAELPGLVLELYPPRRGETTGALRLELDLPGDGRRVHTDPDGRTVVVSGRAPGSAPQ